MWIHFESQERFAIKIYVGSVNAVSGESTVETEATQARRYKLLSKHKSIQDYVVTPDQLWLDGIASNDGTVRQFVAMSLGSGYTVEAQITGADLVGGLQIEVTPVKEMYAHALPSREAFVATVHPKPAGTPHFDIYFKTLVNKLIPIKVSALHTIDEVKELIAARGQIVPDQQRLMCRSVQLEDGRTVGEYGITAGSTLTFQVRLCGGGGPKAEMGIAAGGLIKQTILTDNNDPEIWDTDSGAIFNVQILNSTLFQSVTGRVPPSTPITAQEYASYGFPYYEIYDEKPSGIKGDFSGVKSVAEKDLEGAPTLEKAKAIAEVIEDTDNPVIVLDKTGGYSGFRPVKTMEEDLIKKFGKLDVATPGSLAGMADFKHNA